MNVFKELDENYVATFRLQKRYLWLTSIVGLCSVFLGIAIMLALFFYVAPIMGYTPSSKPSDNALEAVAAAVAVIFGFILCVYIGVLIVAGSFSFFMYKLGRFSKEQAVFYTLISRYPDYWFNKNP